MLRKATENGALRGVQRNKRTEILFTLLVVPDCFGYLSIVDFSKHGGDGTE
jgi:hypothetical protein